MMKFCGEAINRCCNWIDEKIDDGTCIPVVRAAHSSMRQIGNVLVFVVYFISLTLAFTSFFIILPYEQLYKPPALLFCLSIIGLYVLIHIQYHYYKARTSQPVANPGEEGDAFCAKCNYWKSAKTHHCSVCRKCILGMDHHCIWINQCVGSHNHRHFFLFIANLTVAAAIIVIAGFPSAYDHVFLETSDSTYCTAILEYAPLQGFICDYDGFARTSIVFVWLLSVILGIMVGGLTLWNGYLISIGYTYIDYLGISKQRNKPARLNRGLKQNWKNFLGLRRNRTFFQCVILPSSLPPICYEQISKFDPFEVV